MRRATRALAAAGALALSTLLPGCGSQEPAADVRPGLPDAEVPGLLAALTDGDAPAVHTAAQRIEQAGDRRFVAVLVELLRASQLGIAGRAGYNERVVLLERLSRQSFGGDWFAWAEWYGVSDLEPPPGFATWKGGLLGRIDPRFAAFLEDGVPARIRVEEVDWGGVPVEGIPALDDPKTVPAAQASGLEPGEPVFGIALGGEARAYPLRILDWHELANDRLGGVPFSLAYCTLCGSGIAYDTRRPDGPPRRFATSGLLYRSNKLMFDRATRTLWSQLTGEPVLGPLAARELRLPLLPLVLTTWEDWRTRHPETTVLSLATGYDRPYRPGEPYGGYFASPQKLFPAFQTRGELKPKERVFGLWREGAARAWTLDDLTAARVLNDALAGHDVVLLAGATRIRVEGASARIGPVHYDAGAPVRAYWSGGHRFAPGSDDDTVLDEAGRPWRVGEDALLGPDGARAERAAGTLVYWFAWQAFHPHTLLYRP